MPPKSAVAKPAVDSNPFEGVADILPEEARETLVAEIVSLVKDAVRTGDIEKARLASIASQTIKRGVGVRDQTVLKVDERWIEGVRMMAEREFKIPSHLAKYRDELQRRR